MTCKVLIRQWKVLIRQWEVLIRQWEVLIRQWKVLIRGRITALPASNARLLTLTLQ